MANKVVYLDFNGTYPPDGETLEEMTKWAKKGNISSNYTSAEDGKYLLDKFKREIADLCEFSLTGEEGFTIIFTSGASESNSFIIQSACRAFIRAKNIKPHIISSCIEHDSIRLALRGLEKEYLQYDELGVNTTGVNFGLVRSETLSKYIKKNTCLISIMASNNETGVINNLKDICDVAHSKGIPVHTDAVQLFAKQVFKPNEYGVDSFSVSFHKIGGPVGAGFLAIKNSLLDGYDLPPLIYGSQQGEMRGGTIPIHNLAASRNRFNRYFYNRELKTTTLQILKSRLIDRLEEIYPVSYITDFGEETTKPSIVILAPKNLDKVMVNTLLFAIYKDDICNVQLRKDLYEYGVIVSIGSACKTKDKSVSHVISSLEIPPVLHSGILRISLGDCTQEEDIDRFVSILAYLLRST